MRRAKQIVASVMLVLGFALTSLSVCAADDLLGTVVDGSLLTDDTYAEGYAYPRMRGSILSYGSGSIAIEGTRRVRVTGSTSAYRNVSQIKVTMHLQRLKNGSWVHVLTLGPKIKYNTNYVTNSTVYSVAGGYYYRASGTHTAINGSTAESSASYSDGVWVA